MSAKSSLPIFGCDLKRTFAGSTTVRATSATTWDCSSWFTSTLNVSRISAMISTWKALAMPAQIARVVQPINLVAGKFLEQPILDHGAGAAEAFFGRLKDEMHGAVEIPGLREIARGAEQHGGVAVMAAAVKAAGNGRAPFQVGILFHRQRVHVGAQANAPAAAAFALEHADHAGAAEAAMYLDAPLGQLVSHDAGGPDFLEADFGMGVQIPADRGEFLGIAFDAVDVGHVCYPVAE